MTSRVLSRPQSGARGRRGGFTLVELLTVIAIIAILSAILLPVLSGTRRHATRAHCTSNLHQIAISLGLYKQDNKGFPPDLAEAPLPAGARWYGSGGQGGAGLGALYPDYLPSLKAFNCRDSDVSSPDDPAYNSYDGTDPAKQAPDNLKYRRIWQRAGAGPDASERRQLCWLNPPEDTVVTWCQAHRNNPEGTTLRAADRDPVVFLDGHVDLAQSMATGHGYGGAAP